MGKHEKTPKPERKGTFVTSCSMLVICMAILMIGIVGLQTDASIALMFAAIAAALYGLWLHIPFEELEQAIIKSVSESLGAMIMVLIVGTLIASWIACGTVPYIVYLGLSFVDPGWFPVIALLMSAAMALVTGSSWTTTGTLGVAFVGIAVGLEIPVGLVAGAVVCGAFFGDKSSPLSSIALMISGISKVTVYQYSKNVLKVNLPAMALTTVIFGVLGQQYSGNAVDLGSIRATCDGLAEIYRFSPVLWLPLVLLLVMILFRTHAMPTLIVGMLSGVVLAVVYQDMSLQEVLTCLYSGFSIDSGVAQVDQILNRGGLASMLSTMGLLVVAMSMAGVIDRTEILLQIVQRMGGIVQNRVGLIAVTLATGIFVSFFASDPFVASLVALKAFEKSFDQLGLDRTMLARTVAEASMCPCPIVPWSGSGVFAARALGVGTSAFLPYYFMGIIPLILTMASAVTGIGIKYDREERKDEV